MHTVTVNKDELREIVQTNLDEHRQTFLDAQDIYRDKVIEWLEQRLEDARNGRKIRRYIELPEPVDYTDEYERVIHMLAMSVDETIELNAQDFKRFVRDEWEWSGNFAANTAVYTDEFHGDDQIF